MIVYGHRTFALPVRPFLDAFQRRLSSFSGRAAHDEVVDLLVDFAEVESAVADARLPDADDDLEELAAWRTAAGAVASAFCASASHDERDVSRRLAEAQRAIARLDSVDVPATVEGRVAEGFACYALYPEQYVDAANRFATDRAARRVFCLGLRSIGSMLAHVVAATLTRRGLDTDVRTVRPRGHPFDRRLVLSGRLQNTIVASRASHYAVVDEGPGLSGSSFAAAAEALRALGIPASRIVLVSSWDAPVDLLRSERARRAWSTCRRVVGRFDHRAAAAGVIGADAASLLDLSGGRWRDRVYANGDERPAVQPQHERVKFTDGDARVARFAGLGRHGRAKRDRAAALAERGFGARPRALRHGVLVLDWIPGTPLDLVHQRRAADVRNRLADYLASIRRDFSTVEAARTDDLVAMMRVNVREGLGEEYARAIDRLAPDYSEPCVAVDSRMMPCEWIDPGEGLPILKTDALDHHADDFLPGCRDIAWDVAGAIVEFDMDPACTRHFAAEYALRSGDWTIERRLPFYSAAYLAYRLGYVTMAAEALGASPDGDRFRQLQRRYRHSLAALLADSRPSAPR